MVSDATLKKTVWVASALLVTVAVGGAGLAAGRWLGYGEGLEVAEMETAATLRREVEAASALRVGDPRTAALLLELGIDDHAHRLMEARDNPRVYGVLTRLAQVSPEHALGAAQLYRGLVVSPVPHAEAFASRLAALPKVEMALSPALEKILAGQSHAGPVSTGAYLETAEFSRDGDTLYVRYSSRRSLVDCPGQQVEMNEVWTRLVRERLKDPAIRSVVLWPEEVLGRSASFDFTRNESGRWSAPAPCQVRIAP